MTYSCTPFLLIGLILLANQHSLVIATLSTARIFHLSVRRTVSESWTVLPTGLLVSIKHVPDVRTNSDQGFSFASQHTLNPVLSVVMSEDVSELYIPSCVICGSHTTRSPLPITPLMIRVAHLLATLTSSSTLGSISTLLRSPTDSTRKLWE